MMAAAIELAMNGRKLGNWGAISRSRTDAQPGGGAKCCSQLPVRAPSFFTWVEGWGHHQTVQRLHRTGFSYGPLAHLMTCRER